MLKWVTKLNFYTTNTRKGPIIRTSINYNKGGAHYRQSKMSMIIMKHMKLITIVTVIKNLRESQSMQDYARVCQGMQEYA